VASCICYHRPLPLLHQAATGDVGGYSLCLCEARETRKKFVRTDGRKQYQLFYCTRSLDEAYVQIGITIQGVGGSCTQLAGVDPPAPVKMLIACSKVENGQVSKIGSTAAVGDLAGTLSV